MSILSKEIHTLIEISRQHSIRGAAERLNISASALSRQIQILEADLGVPLLTRHAKGVVLTEHGERLLLHAERMIQMENGLRNRISEATKQGHVDFNLGVMESVGPVLVPKLRKRLTEIDDRICLNVTVDGTSELVARLLDRRLDVVVAFNIPTHENIRMSDVTDLQIGLVSRQGFLREPPASIDLSACLDWPLCLPGSDLSVHTRLMSEIHRQKKAFRIAATSNSFAVLRSLIADGAGVGFMSHLDIMAQPDAEGLSLIPLRDRRLSEKLGIATVSSVREGPTLSLVLRHVRELMREIAGR